jgi:hypothetical protein
VLAGATVVASLVPAEREPDVVTVEHAVTIPLVLVLFDGGMKSEWGPQLHDPLLTRSFESPRAAGSAKAAYAA